MIMIRHILYMKWLNHTCTSASTYRARYNITELQHMDVQYMTDQHVRYTAQYMAYNTRPHTPSEAGALRSGQIVLYGAPAHAHALKLTVHTDCDCLADYHPSGRDAKTSNQSTPQILTPGDAAWALQGTSFWCQGQEI